MTQTKIEAVIFDAGGVLHGNNRAVSKDITHTIGTREENVAQVWANLFPLLQLGLISEDVFWEQAHYQYCVGRLVDVRENLLGRPFEKALRPKRGVLALVDELGDRGVKLAVLSNVIEPHSRVLREQGVYEGFDELFLSHETGLVKPDVEAYEHALRVMGTEPEATVFIDDHRKNVVAARSLGMHGILFKYPKQLVSEIDNLIPRL